MLSPKMNFNLVMIGLFGLLYCSFTPVNSQQFRDTPPMYNMDNLPQTRFTCEGKLTGRYYADSDTDCQMFHICAKMSRRDVSDFRFLCPNGTVFDQEHQVCADYYQVVCHTTNPLGQVFEIFKLSSKESTNKREFGHVPVRDPDYLGQNNLGGGEDFQAEEYNNNKLASSRNSIFPNIPDKGSSKNNIFFQYSTQKTTSTTTTTSLPTTHAALTTTTTPRPTAKATFATTAEPFVPSQSTRESYTPTKAAQNRNTASPSTSPRPATQSAKFLFSDFASLAKFQAQFHGLVTHAPKKVSVAPTSTTERQTTPSRPRNPVPDFIEYESTTLPPSTYVTTFAPQRSNPTSTKRPEGNFHFTDFKSLAKFQENFHKSFSSAPESRTFAPTTVDLDFNTRPRSETTPPQSFPTTHRPALYQNTFRTTFTDLTTPSPQTFQQQPSRFDEEFFRKVIAQNELKSTTNSFDRNEESESNNPEDTFSSTAKSVRRGGRRRINPNRRHKYSQKVENVKFEGRERESFTNKENSKFDEIFDTEASIFPRPADINKFYTQEVQSVTLRNTTNEGQSQPEVLLSGGERDVFGRRIRPFKEGKRVQLGSKQDFASTLEPRPNRRTIKRLRQKPSTETITSESYISPTTYRPSLPVQLRTGSTSVSRRTTENIPTTQSIFQTTTTEEPELVTASDEEIQLLRKKNKYTATTELSSVKVTPKSSPSSTLSFKRIEKPIKKSNNDEESVTASTRSPDYDYIYYDTDLDNDYAEAAKQSKFGKKKSNQVIIKS